MEELCVFSIQTNKLKTTELAKTSEALAGFENRSEISKPSFPAVPQGLEAKKLTQSSVV